MSEFTPKTLDEAVWEMLALWWSRTGVKPDLEEGSVLRTLFEAVGFQVEDMSLRFERGLARTLPAAVFDAFGFTPLPPLKATTSLIFERGAPYPTPLDIPAGLRVAKLDGVEIEVITATQIAANQSASAPVAAIAVQAGASGNAPVNAYTIPRATLPTLTRVYNNQPATGGQDAESLDSQKRRFALYLAQLQRGTKAALQSAALAVLGPSGERATEVLVLDATDRPVLIPGAVEVWVDDGLGTAATPLLGAIASALELIRSAGAYVQVYAAQAVAIGINAQIDTANSEAVSAAQDAARAYLKGLRIGQKISRENLITALTNAHPDIREVTVNSPATDTVLSYNQRATVGTLNIS